MTQEQRTKAIAEIQKAVADMSPASFDNAFTDCEWLSKNEDGKHTFSYWVEFALREGAKAKRRSVQLTIDNNRRKQAEESQKKDEKSFTEHILANPKVALDLSELLKVASIFKISTDVVLAIHAKAQEAQAKNVEDAKRKAA